MIAAAGSFWFPSLDDLSRFSPELALVATIAAVLIAPLFIRRSGYTTAAIVLIGVLVACALNSAVAARVAAGGITGLSPERGATMLLTDNFAVFFKFFLMLFVALVTALWLIGPQQGRQDPPEFFTLLVGSALGMALMVSSLNLLMLLLAVEMASLPSYALAGFNKRSRPGAEGSLKYVVFGAVTSAIMLYGISLLYGYYGTLDVGELARIIAIGKPAASGSGEYVVAAGGNLILAISLFGLMVGIGFKVSAVPFHFWCPDVFEGAEIEVTTWLSVASKAAGLGLLLRVVYTLAHPGGVALPPSQIVHVLTPLAWGIGIIAAITCTFGNLAAFRQTNIKRLLAYSSIAHAGYMLMAGAILVHYTPGTPHLGLSAVVAYLFVYLFMNLGAFGVAALLGWQTGKHTLDAFTGLGRRAPWLAVPMAVCLFSLTGLPPLGGFVVKYWLLVALFDAGAAAQATTTLLYLLIFVAVLNTLLSLFYYVRVVREMFLSDDGQPVVRAPFGGLALVNACAVILLLTGTLLIGLLKDRADGYATHMFRPAAKTEYADQSFPMPRGMTRETEHRSESPSLVPGTPADALEVELIGADRPVGGHSASCG